MTTAPIIDPPPQIAAQAVQADVELAQMIIAPLGWRDEFQEDFIRIKTLDWLLARITSACATARAQGRSERTGIR